jgi:hypothetical protein
MMVEQVTVFLQNEKGRLMELTKVLADNNINISALSVAENAEYGVMRLIVNDTDKAIEVLKEADFSAKKTNVILVNTPDVPGALSSVLTKWADAGISISYMYGYSSGDVSNLILKVSDPEKAVNILEK